MREDKDEKRADELVRFNMLRQQKIRKGVTLSLSDFIAPEKLKIDDYMGLFAVTVKSNFSKKAKLVSRLTSAQSTLCLNDTSIVGFEKSGMMNKAYGFLIKRDFRILNLCAGDLGYTSSITYDFEVFSKGQEKWLEISSVSNFKTYQSNRLNLKFKDKDGCVLREKDQYNFHFCSGLKTVKARNLDIPVELCMCLDFARSEIF